MTSLEYWSWIHKLYGSDLGLDEEELPHDYVEPVDEETATKEKEKEEARGTPDVASRVGEDLAEVSKREGSKYLNLILTDLCVMFTRGLKLWIERRDLKCSRARFKSPQSCMT